MLSLDAIAERRIREAQERGDLRVEEDYPERISERLASARQR